MPYYLVHKRNLDDIKIVASCEKDSHKEVILNRYCRSNDIILVEDRPAVTANCQGNQLFSYQVSANRYIVLNCYEHPKTYIFNRYVEKEVAGELEFLYHNPEKMTEMNDAQLLELKKKLPLPSVQQFINLQEEQRKKKLKYEKCTK